MTNGHFGGNSPEVVSRQRVNSNGGLRPPSGRSSESGYDSVERDLHKISKEPAKPLEELWDIIDGKNSLLTKRYKDILKSQKGVGRHEEIIVAYGSYEKGYGGKGSSSSKGTSGATAKPVVSCFGTKGKPDPDYDYPDGMPGNMKRMKPQGAKHSPQGQGQGDPWRSEVRGVVGVEASADDRPDVSRDRKLAQGSEFDRYLGNEAVSSSQKRYENFKVNRSWRKDSKPQPGAVHAALTRLNSRGELSQAPIREQREPSNYQSVTNKGSYNRSTSHRESAFSYQDRGTGAQRMTKSHTFDMDRRMDRENLGRFNPDSRQSKSGDRNRSNRHSVEYSDRERDSRYGARYRDLDPSFVDVTRDRDYRSSRLDRFEMKEKKLASTGMNSREVNPEAFHNAKSRFESPWPEDETYPKTAFSGQSTRTPLGRYEAKIRSRSESPSRARAKSAEPPKTRAGYKYEPFRGGNVRDSEYGSMAKSTPSLHSKVRESDVTKTNTGVTLKYDPKTGKVSDPLGGAAFGKDYGRYQDNPTSKSTQEKKWGFQIPPGTNRPGASLSVSAYERRPDGQSTPSQQSTNNNNTNHKSTDRTEHHMRLEDSERSHKSLEPVRLNLLTSPSSVLPSKSSTFLPPDQTDGRFSGMGGAHYDSTLSNRQRSLNDLSNFNRTPRPFVSSHGQGRGLSYRSRDSDFPNLSEFREEIKREVTGKEKSPPQSENQDTRPSKPPRSWSTQVQASQDSLNDYGDAGRWSDNQNRPRPGDRDPGPEPGKLQKWSPGNLAHTSSFGSSNDTLIIKGSDPDLTEHSHNRTFESVKQMKNVLAKNLEKAKSEPDMMAMAGGFGNESPRGAKSEENVPETTRSANFHEIRAKYEADAKAFMDESTRPVQRTISGDLRDIRDQYNRGEAFRNREWEKNEPQTPRTPLGAPMPFMSVSKQQSPPAPGYPPRKATPPLPPKDTRKNYNTPPVVEQVQRLISSDGNSGRGKR